MMKLVWIILKRGVLVVLAPVVLLGLFVGLIWSGFRFGVCEAEELLEELVG